MIDEIREQHWIAGKFIERFVKLLGEFRLARALRADDDGHQVMYSLAPERFLLHLPNIVFQDRGGENFIELDDIRRVATTPYLLGPV